MERYLRRQRQDLKKIFLFFVLSTSFGYVWSASVVLVELPDLPISEGNAQNSNLKNKPYGVESNNGQTLTHQPYTSKSNLMAQDQYQNNQNDQYSQNNQQNAKFASINQPSEYYSKDNFAAQDQFQAYPNDQYSQNVQQNSKYISVNSPSMPQKIHESPNFVTSDRYRSNPYLGNIVLLKDNGKNEEFFNNKYQPIVVIPKPCDTDSYSSNKPQIVPDHANIRSGNIQEAPNSSLFFGSDEDSSFNRDPSDKSSETVFPFILFLVRSRTNFNSSLFASPYNTSTRDSIPIVENEKERLVINPNVAYGANYPLIQQKQIYGGHERPLAKVVLEHDQPILNNFGQGIGGVVYADANHGAQPFYPAPNFKLGTQGGVVYADSSQNSQTLPPESPYLSQNAHHGTNLGKDNNKPLTPILFIPNLESSKPSNYVKHTTVPTIIPKENNQQYQLQSKVMPYMIAVGEPDFKLAPYTDVQQPSKCSCAINNDDQGNSPAHYKLENQPITRGDMAVPAENKLYLRSASGEGNMKATGFSIDNGKPGPIVDDNVHNGQAISQLAAVVRYVREQQPLKEIEQQQKTANDQSEDKKIDKTK